MNIVNNNYEVVKKDLLKAIDILYISNNIDEMVTAYIGIIDFYEDIQIKPELFEVFKKLKKIEKTNKWKLACDSLSNSLSIFEEQLKTTSDYYFNIFTKQSKIISNVLDSINVNDNYTKLNDNDIHSILNAYFKEKDTRLFKLFNEYIQKRTILQMNLPFYLGNTSSSPIFNNIYIKITKRETFEDMFTILHEMSHAKVFEDIIKTKSNKEYNKFICTNQYIEVYPRLQEKNFLQFLLSNNILVEDIKKYSVKWLLFFNKLLLKNIELYNKGKNINSLDIRDINSFLYRDLLFFNGTSISETESIKNTIEENFYLNNFDINDISSAMTTNIEEIKKLIK